jgi:hypothetical protein
VTDEPGAGLRLTAATGALLTARFLLELALLAAYAVVGVRLVEGIAGWALGAVLVLLVVAVWGQFLSPRRRRELGLGRRVALELVLFLAAGAGLATVGSPVWGVLLVATELVVLGLLRRPGEQIGVPAHD